MSDDASNHAEPDPLPPPVPEPHDVEPAAAAAAGDRGSWSLVALIGEDGQEPAGAGLDAEAQETWCAISALWHPSLLAEAAELPRIENVEYPSSPGANEIRVVPATATDRLPSGYETQTADAGTILLTAGADRAQLVRAIQERIGIASGEVDDALTTVASDFHALGTARWWLRDLTIAMGHVDVLDAESLTREVRSGASAWRAGDAAAATNRLRAAFELLTQARERFYPVDAYLIDVCLLDPNMPAGVLDDALQARTPVTFLASGRAVENQGKHDPERIARLREAISEGWADVVGGAYDEVDEPLLPLESIFWQFHRAGDAYRRKLDDRNVETLARRRFGLYPQLPQIARRFGFRFAVHLGFDAGRFPIRPESKRLWEAPDGSNLEALTRPPLGADRPWQGRLLPWRLAHSMKDDHVATIGLVHWPAPVASWYLDLRRVASYSPVMARWVTLNDYFHLTDRPFESFRPGPDDYQTPYLAQAVARRDAAPISRRAVHARLRARFETLCLVRSLVQAILPDTAHPVPGEADLTPSALEEAIELGRHAEAVPALADQLERWAGALGRGIAPPRGDGRPGYLVINPLGQARRAAVLLPGAAADLRPEGPLRAAQFTEEGVWAVVDLPCYGYAWVPRDTNLERTHPPLGAVSARERRLVNEAMEVEIDRETGGIRGLHALGEPTARLGQQLAVVGANAGGSGAAAVKMRCRSFEVEYAGPALVQAVALGELAREDAERPLATFRQRYRLWSGRPTLEVEITLDDIDPAWLEAAGRTGVDPWGHYLACRWAWPDPNSMLRRTCILGAELTEAERPETSDALDISTRRQRTALVFAGLAHHQKHSARMLDTLLIAGQESARTFTVGVILDLEQPAAAALDFVTPAVVIPTESGPPASGPSGWFVQIDSKSVAITHVEYSDSSGDGRGWGLVFHLIETAGHPARCRLRLFRDPTWARQTDFHNEPIIDLPIEGDAVLVDLTPHEIARVDVTLG